MLTTKVRQFLAIFINGSMTWKQMVEDIFIFFFVCLNFLIVWNFCLLKSKLWLFLSLREVIAWSSKVDDFLRFATKWLGRNWIIKFISALDKLAIIGWWWALIVFAHFFFFVFVVERQTSKKILLRCNLWWLCHWIKAIRIIKVNNTWIWFLAWSFFGRTVKPYLFRFRTFWRWNLCVLWLFTWFERNVAISVWRRSFRYYLFRNILFIIKLLIISVLWWFWCDLFGCRLGDRARSWTALMKIESLVERIFRNITFFKTC